MIIRQFLSWVRTASAGARAEATRALARAWLISDLSDDERAAAEGGLLLQLDDSSPLVRRAMADVFARSANAPPTIVRALSVDQPSVAIPVLEHSPLLTDADLVDIVATGSCEVQCAVARRVRVPVPVCAAIAEVGSAAAALELIENPGADLARVSWDRIVERHGHLPAIREAMLALDGLPAVTRLLLAVKLSDSLARFVVARDWLSAERAGRTVSDARDRSIVDIVARAREDEMTCLVAHLRATGQLTAGLMLRALLSGTLGLFHHALADLSGLPFSRVTALVHDRGGASLPALLTRAGLPESAFPAFRAALEAHEEIGFVATVDGAVRLRRRMVEHVLTVCEAASAEISQPLLTLLRRFATESARDEARVFCDELVAEAARSPMIEDVPAGETALRDLEVREEFYEPVPAIALPSEVEINSLEEDASDQNAGVVYRFGEGMKTSRPRFLDRLALKTRFAEYEPRDAELDDATSPDAVPYEALSCEVLPYETLSYEDEPVEDGPYIVSSCEPKRVEPRFDEPAPYDSLYREPDFSGLKNAPPAYREPLLSDLLAAA
ncbi:conserved hypothetical protein [Nitrobacter winogradskyi Nb-255]|uniref:DUF2336 domain-containing protein n=1 Tax=Nitrobacter winogradskyi (strain ATCC 25391 / DSM 10237 / CIP 104748 / NCIMB 11846 / Nb-255) TaxID=323098 RepID=Q3SSZ8_NITWN|nr:DUF2336 domain-containing protein [Nitrobacter winogradskyi]ABA04593.1 conserved hypothetical protein [Nitrobacter winogradskyi Nb-255]